MADLKAERAKAIEGAVTQIERQFGKGSIMRLGAHETLAMEFIPSGSLAVDFAVGIGGFPRGRVVEIYGPESSGKTTLALSVVGQAQKRGGTAAFIDAEHALDAEYARKLGVDIDNLLVSQPDNGEQALEITEMLVRSNAVDVVVIDSVAALVPRAELEGEMGDSHVGLQARLMSQAPAQADRDRRQVENHTDLHQPDPREDRRHVRQPRDHHRRPGAQVLSSVRIDIRRIAAIKDGETVTGIARQGEGGEEQGRGALPPGRVRHRLRRGHLAHRRARRPRSGAESGAEERRLVHYGDVRLGQGRENAKQFLRDNPDVAEEIETKLRTTLGLPAPATAPAALPAPLRRPSPGDGAPAGRAGLRAERDAVALLALLVLSSAGCGKVAGSGSNRLRVDAPRWWFSLLPVRVTATPSGALAGRNATLTLAVNLNVVGERNTDGKAIAIWLPGSAFSTEPTKSW
jgi:recombination protein RecA